MTKLTDDKSYVLGFGHGEAMADQLGIEMVVHLLSDTIQYLDECVHNVGQPLPSAAVIALNESAYREGYNVGLLGRCREIVNDIDRNRGFHIGIEDCIWDDGADICGHNKG